MTLPHSIEIIKFNFEFCYCNLNKRYHPPERCGVAIFSVGMCIHGIVCLHGPVMVLSYLVSKCTGPSIPVHNNVQLKIQKTLYPTCISLAPSGLIYYNMWVMVSRIYSHVYGGLDLMCTVML